MTHKELLDELRQPVRALPEHIPSVVEGYGALSGSVFVDGALDAKTEELIALDIAVADSTTAAWSPTHAPPGAARLPRRSRTHLGVASVMNGSPGTVRAPRAFEAFQEFARR